MKPSIPFGQMRHRIAPIARRFKVVNPRVFGSVLQGVDADGSDLDLLVDPLPKPLCSTWGGLQGELEDLLAVPLDARTPGGLPAHVRAIVVAEAQPV